MPVPRLEWISNFSSSNVSRFAWNNYSLLVQFTDGSIYSYPVPYQTFVDMKNATSKGEFVFRRLRHTGEFKLA